MNTLIELPSGKVAQITWWESTEFPGNSLYKIKQLHDKWCYYGDQMAEEELAQLAELKKIQGVQVLKLQEIKVTGFAPVAVACIPTADIISGNDFWAIQKAITEQQAILAAQEGAMLWTEEFGVWGTD